MIDDETRRWLVKALNDYKTSEKLLSFPEGEIITDTLCFHCQQAVEKFLKAFLVFHRIEFERIHTLEYLIKLCSTVDREFENFYDITKKLTEYAIQVRYPDDFYMPSVEEAREAFESARKVKEFILKKLKIQESERI